MTEHSLLILIFFHFGEILHLRKKRKYKLFINFPKTTQKQKKGGGGEKKLHHKILP